MKIKIGELKTMSTIKDFFGGGSDLSEIKGTGWDSNDTLKTINDKTEIIKNTTSVIRADTGELNGSAILDLYVTNDLVLTGNITVKKLHVSDGAHITGDYTIVVNESCHIYSGYVDINTLDIRGNLTCKRKIGDTSTICNITLSNLYILGNYSIENTNVTVSDETYIVGETNSDNCSENYNKFIAENNVIIINGRNYSGTNIYINGNFDLDNTGHDFNYSNFYIIGNSNIICNDINNSNDFHTIGDVNITCNTFCSKSIIIDGDILITCTAFNQPTTNHKFLVNGNCTFNNAITCDNVNLWEIQNTLTLPDLTCDKQISIKAKNFIFNGSSLISTGNTNNTKSGNSYVTTGSYLPYTPHYAYGGMCSWLDLIVTDTFNAPNLTSIKSIGSNGSNGSEWDDGWHNYYYDKIHNFSLTGGGGGGSVHGNIYIANANFNNTVNIAFLVGSGGSGKTHTEYSGSKHSGNGANGVINSNGLNGSDGTSGDLHNNNQDQHWGIYSAGGGGSAGFIGGNAGASYSRFQQTKAPDYDVTGNILIENELNGTHTTNITGGTVDTNTKSIPNFNLLSLNLYPNVPVLVTENNTTNPTTLEFTIPTFFEDIDFDFEIYIEKQLTEKIHESVIVKNTNDNPNDFSGTAPYLQGSGNVSFTLPTLDPNLYRWKVKCMKDSDTSIASIYSDWRYFTISS